MGIMIYGIFKRRGVAVGGGAAIRLNISSRTNAISCTSIRCLVRFQEVFLVRVSRICGASHAANTQNEHGKGGLDSHATEGELG